MAIVLVMGMSQCKKNEQTASNDEKVTINLRLNNGNGAKLHFLDEVDNTVPVRYDEGDIVYVACNGVCLGTLQCTFANDLTYADFSGQIVEPELNAQMIFINMGGVQQTVTDNTVNFSFADQSVKPAVLSVSEPVTYTGPENTYRAFLHNKSVLVKFALSETTDADLTIKNVLNTATVSFDGTVTPGSTTGNIITYNPDNGTSQVRYAVVPVGQTAITNGSISGDEYSGTFSFSGEATANAYLKGTMTLTQVHDYFTVGNKKIRFAKGNLQATTTNGGQNQSWSWAFAANAYDIIGTNGANLYVNGNGTLSVTSGTIDLFCWSTTNTYYGIHNDSWYGTYSGDFRDWGTLPIYNPETENTDPAGTWRTLSQSEWIDLLDNHTSGWIQVEGVNGLIILPDGMTEFESSYTAEAWASLENAGAAFLPTAGRRYVENGLHLTSVGVMGYYWSSTGGDKTANDMIFDYTGPFCYNFTSRWDGVSVRLVQDIE